MEKELKQKVLYIAAQICLKHGVVAGVRVCQDWDGETDLLDSLTPTERHKLSYDYEQFNSNGVDFEPGHFPYDEMMISFYIAKALKTIADEEA